MFLIAIGTGLLAVAWRGWQIGEVPAGSNGLRPYRSNRSDNPLAFYLFLALYGVGGMALVVWGLLILAGLAPPLQLR